MRSHDLVVVGGGPAGLATAMYAAMRGLAVVLFEAETFGGQLINLYPGKPVTNFPAQESILSKELALRLADQAGHFGAELHEWEPVESVSEGLDGYVVKTPDREVVAPAVVLALGLGRFMPRRLGLEGEERLTGKGVTYRLPELDEIEAAHIVVVGGGDTALDAAMALRDVAEVTLVHRRLEFSACAYSQNLVREAGLTVVRCGEVVELRGKDRLESVVVRLGNEEIVDLPADLLLVTIGQVPDLRDLEQWNLDIRGPHLDVDSEMRTNKPGLYAVGDFAAYPGKVRMIATAVAEGSTAAASVQRQLKAAA